MFKFLLACVLINVGLLHSLNREILEFVDIEDAEHAPPPATDWLTTFLEMEDPDFMEAKELPFMQGKTVEANSMLISTFGVLFSSSSATSSNVSNGEYPIQRLDEATLRATCASIIEGLDIREVWRKLNFYDQELSHLRYMWNIPDQASADYVTKLAWNRISMLYYVSKCAIEHAPHEGVIPQPLALLIKYHDDIDYYIHRYPYGNVTTGNPDDKDINKRDPWGDLGLLLYSIDNLMFFANKKLS